MRNMWTGYDYRNRNAFKKELRIQLPINAQGGYASLYAGDTKCFLLLEGPCLVVARAPLSVIIPILWTLIRTCCERGVFGARRARANVVSANSRLAKKRGDGEEYVSWSL